MNLIQSGQGLTEKGHFTQTEKSNIYPGDNIGNLKWE